MTERRYDEKEVALILRNAAESRVGGEGLSLRELKQIAAEVGIDPAAVEAAAGAIDRREASVPSPLLGTPVTSQFEQSIEAPFEGVDQSELVLAVRRALGRHGVVEHDPNGVEWRARDASGGRYVSVLRRGPKTLVRVLGNFREGAVAWVVAGGTMTWVATLLMLKGAGVLTPGLGKGLGVLAAMGVGYLGGRLLWRWRYRQERHRLQAALEAAVSVVQRSAGTTVNETDEG